MKNGILEQVKKDYVKPNKKKPQKLVDNFPVIDTSFLSMTQIYGEINLPRFGVWQMKEDSDGKNEFEACSQFKIDCGLDGASVPNGTMRFGGPVDKIWEFFTTPLIKSMKLPTKFGVELFDYLSRYQRTLWNKFGVKWEDRDELTIEPTRTFLQYPAQLIPKIAVAEKLEMPVLVIAEAVSYQLSPAPKYKDPIVIAIEQKGGVWGEWLSVRYLGSFVPSARESYVIKEFTND